MGCFLSLQSFRRSDGTSGNNEEQAGSTLEGAINRGELIPADSPEEVEIRAHTLYATALLTDAINRVRPPSQSLVVPQVDFRLWKAYHATFWPHHLTRTIMY